VRAAAQLAAVAHVVDGRAEPSAARGRAVIRQGRRELTLVRMTPDAPMVAPDATAGSLWETTSPVTLAPLRSSTTPQLR
jgi:hypothetical protein